jgi:hypothetical protein
MQETFECPDLEVAIDPDSTPTLTLLTNIASYLYHWAKRYLYNGTT